MRTAMKVGWHWELSQWNTSISRCYRKVGTAGKGKMKWSHLWMYSLTPGLYHGDISAAQMDLHTDEDMGHWWKMLDLAELPAGTGSACSSIRAQYRHIFWKWFLVLPLGLCFCVRAKPSLHFSNQIKECKDTDQEAELIGKRILQIGSLVGSANRGKLYHYKEAA